VTARSPGRDGTAKCGPFTSGKGQDGGPYNAKQTDVGDYGGLRRSLLGHSIISYTKRG